MPVEAVKVEEVEIAPAALLLGSTEPRRRSVVAAAIDGYVIGYPASEGKWVKEGEVLALLRDDVLRWELKEAEAHLEETRELHRRARLDLERIQKLVEKDAKTQKELDWAVAEERTQSLKIPQIEARLEILKSDLAKKKVVAPFDGQVVREATQIGEYLPRGGAVAHLVDLSSVFVRVNVPERYLRFAVEGQKVKVLVPATKTAQFEGLVASIAGEGDAGARTFPVRVEVQNSGELKAGMSARVELRTGEPQKALVIPKDALLQQGDQEFVLVVKNGAAERRLVKTGEASGDRIAVTSGLEAGEQVIVKGNERIQPGMPVRLVSGASGEPKQ